MEVKMIQGFLIFSAILVSACCIADKDSSRSRQMGNFSFRIMSVIHDNPLRRLLDSPVRSLNTSDIKPGDEVLEVGCGNGYFTVSAAEVVGENGCIHAIDLQPLAIETTKKKVEQAALKNVDLKLADAADTGLPDSSIDVVFLFGVIHSLPLDKVLPELHRILRSGGLVSVRGAESWIKPVTEGGLFRFVGRDNGVLKFQK
jgi:SAM-dependent methyltransferase